MFLIIEHFIASSSLHNFPRIHNYNSISNTCHYTQIMGNQYNCCSQSFPDILHQVHDLCLNCYIKRSCWLICNQNLRLSSKCNCNHNSLAHTTRKFMWIFLHTHIRIRNTNQFQHFQCLFFCIFL